MRLIRPGWTRSIGSAPVGDLIRGAGLGMGIPKATPFASGGGGIVYEMPVDPNCIEPGARGPIGAPRRALVPDAELAAASDAAGPAGCSFTGGLDDGTAAATFSSTALNRESRLFAPDMRKKCFCPWLAHCVGDRDGTKSLEICFH